DTNTRFTMATKMFKFMYNKPRSDVSFDYEFDTIDDNVGIASLVEENINNKSEYFETN
ncbi:16540_t:CDS:1, partial [Dentiscutata heterogama]